MTLDLTKVTTGNTEVQFTQSGTGADARDLKSKLEEWVSVKDFGAIGNGTGDQSSKINEAIAEVAARGGGVVFFPAGIYQIEAGLTVEGTGVYLQGVGRGDIATGPASTLKVNFGTGSAITIEGASAITDNGIADMTITYNVSTSSGAAIRIIDAIRVTISGLNINGAWVGIHAGDGSSAVGGIRIKDCRIGSKRDGILVSGTNDSGGLWLDRVHLNGDDPGEGSRAIVLEGGGFDSVWITDTLVETHDGGLRVGGSSGAFANFWIKGLVVDRFSGIGVHLETSGSGTINNVLLHGAWMNALTDTGDSNGIFINNGGNQSAADITSIVINGCFAKQLRQRFVWLVGKLQDIAITGNLSSNGFSSSNNFPAISANVAVNGLTITGNVISGVPNNGVLLGSASTNLAVTGNTIRGNGSTAIQDNGTPGATRVIANNAA